MLLAYKYGAKPPLQWTAEHEEILELRRQLWNDLREVYLEFVAREEAIFREAGGDELAAIEAALERSEQEIRAGQERRLALRQAARGLVETPDLDAEIREAIRRKRAVRARYWQQIASLRRREDVGPRIRDLRGERTRALAHIACGHSRRYKRLKDGDYNDVYRSFMRAITPTIAKRKGPPREKERSPADDAASLYVQLPGGRTWTQLTQPIRSARHKVQIIENYRPNARITRRWCLLRVQVADRLWLEIPFRLCREVPAGARIKALRIVRVPRPGRRHWYDWSVVLSLDTGVEVAPVMPRGDERSAWLGINWRVTSDGIRLLDGLHADGSRLQVLVPQDIRMQWAYSRMLEGALRQRRNAIRERDEKWLADGMVPEGHRDQAHDAIANHGRGHLRDLARAGDTPELRLWVEGLPMRDHHEAILSLDGMQDRASYFDELARVLGDVHGFERVHSLRAKLARRRRDLYQRVAREIVSRCDRIYIGELDGPEVIATQDIEVQLRGVLPLSSRHLRTIYAPFDLRAAIEWQAKKVGVEVISVPAKDASRTCPVHGTDMYGEDGLRKADLWLPCEECGESWDRDLAYALNVMAASAPTVRERLVWPSSPSECSQIAIVNLVAEVERRVRVQGGHHSRVQHKAGKVLAIEV
jgi:hypothetical protein